MITTAIVVTAWLAMLLFGWALVRGGKQREKAELKALLKELERDDQ